MLVHAWEQLSSWFFWILKEQNKIKAFKCNFDHESKKQYLKRNGKDRGASTLTFLTVTCSILQTLPYIYIRIYLRDNSFHGDYTSPQPENCFIFQGPQELWYLEWWRPAGLLKLDSRKNRGQQNGISPGIVCRSDLSNKPLLLCYRGKKPQTPEALRGNSRGGLSKIFETGHPFQTQPY